MPLTYRIDTTSQVVTITGDYADAAEWRTLLSTITTDRRFYPGLSFIRDLRASSHPVDAQTVVGIMTVIREFWSRYGARGGAIVTRPGVDDPAMVAQALAQDARLKVRAFTCYDEALAWLRKS